MPKKTQMNMEDIIQKTREIVMDKLEVSEDQITSDASFIYDLGADSLDHVELMMEFEKEFNIAIQDNEWEKVNTFGDAIKLIESKQ
jgi:acyl carrier protein